MRREPHVRFCERAAVRFRRATHLVLGCQREEDGKELLAALKDRLTQFGLSVQRGQDPADRVRAVRRRASCGRRATHPVSRVFADRLELSDQAFGLRLAFDTDSDLSALGIPTDVAPEPERAMNFPLLVLSQ